MISFDLFYGLILLAVGPYAFLLANGTLPRSPKDPEAMEVWRKKLGKPLRIASPLLMLFGLIKIVSAL